MINFSSKLSRQRLTPEFVLFSIILVSVIIRALWILTPAARDEGAVGYVAMVWSKGILPYQAPMSSVNPPLAYIFYLIPTSLFGNTIIPIRIINDVLFIISIIALYRVAKNWFGQKTGLLSAAFYGVFFSAPIFEANLAEPSSLALPFVVLSIYLLDVWFNNRAKKTIFGAGFLMSIAALIVQYYVLGLFLLLFSIFLVLYIEHKHGRKSIRLLMRKSTSAALITTIGFLLLFLILSIYFLVTGIFDAFFQATVTRFLGSSSYVSQPEVYFSMIYLIFLEALPLWLFSIVGFILCLLRRNKYDWILLLWAVLMLLIAIPPPHFGRHFAQIVPPLAILSSISIAVLMENIQLGSLRPLKSIRDNSVGVFLIVILIATMIPTIGYQSCQYPNTNYTLFGETWNYTFSNNWGQQQELVNYINDRASNESVLIHGWEAELYWLTSHLAPGIRWASSYISEMPDITKKDYQDILQQVDNGTFRYAIVMTNFKKDDIMNLISDKYFLVRNIGPYAIYDLYNPQGDKTVFSFVKNLNQSNQEYWLQNGSYGNILSLNDSVFIPIARELTISNETASAIEQVPIGYVYQQPGNSSLVYSSIYVPANSSLTFGVTLLPDAWKKPTDGVVFEILLRENNSLNQVYYRYINPAKDLGDRRLDHVIIDLSSYAGRNVTFCFVTNAGPKGDISYDWAYWWNPQLLQHVIIRGQN